MTLNCGMSLINALSQVPEEEGDVKEAESSPENTVSLSRLDAGSSRLAWRLASDGVFPFSFTHCIYNRRLHADSRARAGEGVFLCRVRLPLLFHLSLLFHTRFIFPFINFPVLWFERSFNCSFTISPIFPTKKPPTLQSG